MCIRDSSELFVPIVEINSPYGYKIKKLPIPQRRDFMIEQLIAEATECDFKVEMCIRDRHMGRDQHRAVVKAGQGFYQIADFVDTGRVKACLLYTSRCV